MELRRGACEHGSMTKGIPSPLRWRLIAAGALLTIVIGLAVGESMGWPFLGGPMQRWIGQAIDRRVSFQADPAAKPVVLIHLLGGVRVEAARIEIGAPAWSKAPHMLLARDAQLTLGYGDLIRAAFGAPLRIRELRAAELDGHIERLADGKASWQFGRKTNTPDPAETPTHLPSFGRLMVGAGTLAVRDALIELQLDGRFSLTDSSPSAAGGAANGMQFSAEGVYRKQPMNIEMQSNGVLATVADDAASAALPVSLNVKSGAASLSFKGTATDALKLTALKGRFVVQGSSLAAVGDPLRVTLPTTGPFRAEGLIAKEGRVWNALFNQVSVGSSRLAGAFIFDPRPRLPLLSGRLTGTNLTLADLGPAVGAPVRKGASPAAVAASAPPPAVSKSGHVLPNREFDLPALRAMDASVLIDIDNLDLGSSFLQALRPLRTHLVLADGVLSLRELDARTGQGSLGGTVQLDGRNAQALWTADLRWDGVRLESWIHQSRSDSAPPYVTGKLNGRARVAGQGKSTAAILGSLRGEVRMHVLDGTISHLAVEAAGLDIAQGLGVLLKGDDALPIQCTVVDLVAEQGLFRPRVFVLDTSDSTLWVDGNLSLATEALDLRVVATPKDFSPLALRTPLLVRGTFANPSISLDKGKLGTRLGASVLLGLLNPLAALVPLIDIGSSEDAKRGGEQCRALSERIAARPALAVPALPKRAATKRTG
jgi:AsmA family protein